MIVIAEQRPLELYIPGILKSSSQQGNNKFFIGSNKNLKLDEFKIWDRWGNIVFDEEHIFTNDMEKGWNGTFGGKKVVEGVYIYSIVLTLNDGIKKYFQGSITLIH